jgi:hypothetical protein
MKYAAPLLFEGCLVLQPSYCTGIHSKMQAGFHGKAAQERDCGLAAFW